MPLPLKQYCYFSIYSERTSAAEMAEFLGIKPDKVLVRGSGTTEPFVVPKFHSWSVNCDDTARPLDEQVTALIARLRPYTERIAELAHRLTAEDPLSGASLQIVRYFHETPEPSSSSEASGWYLERDVILFLAATSASLGVDEYDTPKE